MGGGCMGTPACSRPMIKAITIGTAQPKNSGVNTCTEKSKGIAMALMTESTEVDFGSRVMVTLVEESL